MATTSSVTLLSEIIDGDHESIDDLVGARIAAAAGDLAGTSLALPALPGLGAPIDVTPTREAASCACACSNLGG